MDERTAADASAAGDGDGVAAERPTAVRDSLAVGLATAIYGVSFGALSVAAGLDVWQTDRKSVV